MLDVTTILSGAGILIGGMITGIVGAKKLPFHRNGKQHGIELSEETGGAKRISEEGLSKLNKLKRNLEDKYMTTDKHTDLCGKQQSDMKLYISKELNTHTTVILKAIKENGNGP